MKSIFSLIFLMGSFFTGVSQTTQNPLLPATWNIKSEELFSYVTEMAGEGYEGRLTGSTGYIKAADWLAGKLAGWGIEPALPQRSWFQKFKQPYVEVYPGGSLILRKTVGLTDSQEISYQYFNEFMPGSTSGNGEATAEVVFAGYGITANELGYDDYSGVDVWGKLVLLRPEVPVSPSIGAEKFLPWQIYSTHQYKVKNAITHGAIGILYHYGPLANTNCDYHEDLQLSMVGNKFVEDVFLGTGKVYKDLVERISTSLKPQSFATGKIVTMKNVTKFFPDGIGMNVIGLIPGSDPDFKNEVIIIGGHLDHCGKAWETCPGANDNASGVAVMLGVAKAIATSGFHFKRSILFIGIGAEEQGLNGSKAYISDPLFSARKTVVFLNLDCVGVGPDLHAGGGMSFPDLYSVIERANTDYVHRNLSSSINTNLGRPRSDAAIFVQAGIPSISFSSSGGPGAYHTPEDKPSTIWPETLEDLATMLTLAIAELAMISDNPKKEN